MTQAHWLDKIHSENFFREKKANKGFFEIFPPKEPHKLLYIVFMGHFKKNTDPAICIWFLLLKVQLWVKLFLQKFIPGVK